MAESRLLVEICDSLEHVDRQLWNSLDLQGNPFVRHEFLQTLEQTGCLGEATGWYPRYFLLKTVAAESNSEAGGQKDAGEESVSNAEADAALAASGTLVAACACYLKTNSYGEFVFDWAWADAYERHGSAYYPKLVGAIPFTPATGPRLLVAKPDSEPHKRDAQIEQQALYRRLLSDSILEFCRSEQLSSMHWLFLQEDEHDLLVDNKFLSRFDCQYHWKNRDYQNFDDFLAQCTSKRRKTIRRERRYVTDAELRVERRLGSTLTDEEWQLVHHFYCSTFDRKWGNPSLTLDFFKQIGKQFGEQCLIVFGYSDSDTAIAASVMFFGDDTLYGRYWGASEDHHCLHFEACYYQGIEFAIERGLSRFEPGAQGEHKITRGFEPTITRSAHWLADPSFRDAVDRYLKQERPLIQERRQGLDEMLPFRELDATAECGTVDKNVTLESDGHD